MAWCTSSVAGSCPGPPRPPFSQLKTTNVRICEVLPANAAEMVRLFEFRPRPGRRRPGRARPAGRLPAHLAAALRTSAPCGRMAPEEEIGLDAGQAGSAVQPADAVTAGPEGGQGPDALLAALDPEQQEVALSTRGPVCVLAGAGTGKTRAVAHRIGYAVATGVVRPDRVLAVTFTTKAAGELRGRLRQLGSAAVPGAGLEQVQARTFHSAALRQLTHFWPATVGGPAPAVLDSKVGLLAEAARRLRMRLQLAELRDAAAEIEWAKVTQVRPEDYPLACEK